MKIFIVAFFTLLSLSTFANQAQNELAFEALLRDSGKTFSIDPDGVTKSVISDVLSKTLLGKRVSLTNKCLSAGQKQFKCTLSIGHPSSEVGYLLEYKVAIIGRLGGEQGTVIGKVKVTMLE